MRRIALAAIAALAVVPSAWANVPGVSTTHLASRTPDGLFPNGRSADPALSQDRRGASLLAFDSAATNIVAGDTNGHVDVFVVHRAMPFDPFAAKATDWLPGQTGLVSKGLGGQPANGDSFAPDLDGDRLNPPHCVAFLSSASNLVRGDTNGKVDAFVRDLRSGRTRRVSVSSAGRQSNGTTYDVQVDGACDRVAFTSDATNLAYTRSTRKRRRPAVTTAPPRGTRQVYVRILNASRRDDAGLAGLTFLASASNRGKAGDGNSFDAQLGTLHAHGFLAGDTVAFTSEASNLTPGDRNGVADVYERSFALNRVPRHKRPAYMRMRTRLASATSAGTAGNGPSDEPASDDSGTHISFRTAATDIAPRDANGVTDVISADMSSTPPRMTPVARGDGPSSNPASTVNGLLQYAQSASDNLVTGQPSDHNCIDDVFFWSESSGRLALESADSDDRTSGNPQSGTACPDVLTTPAINPAASNFGNYVAFEDGNPLLDLPVADRAFPGLRDRRDDAARMANSDPALHQVYIHFTGP